eukprot:gene20007-26721_t
MLPSKTSTSARTAQHLPDANPNLARHNQAYRNSYLRNSARTALSSQLRANCSSSDVKSARHFDNSVFQYGRVFRVHSEDQINRFVKFHSDRMVILQCKSTTCIPCQRFLHTYTMLAQRFGDSAFLEVYGDETPELRKLMTTWKISTTPTFRMYRNGILVQSIAGPKKAELTDEILAGLKPEHRGREWTEPSSNMDSWSDDE